MFKYNYFNLTGFKNGCTTNPKSARNSNLSDFPFVTRGSGRFDTAFCSGVSFKPSVNTWTKAHMSVTQRQGFLTVDSKKRCNNMKTIEFFGENPYRKEPLLFAIKVKFYVDSGAKPVISLSFLFFDFV